MARIIHREDFLESYSITVFEHENKEWLSLVMFDDKRIDYTKGGLKFSDYFDEKGESLLEIWGKNKEKKGIDYEEVVKELKQRLSIAITVKAIQKTLRFYPENWERWGGIPKQISTFMDYEYDDLLASYIENEN